MSYNDYYDYAIDSETEEEIVSSVCNAIGQCASNYVTSLLLEQQQTSTSTSSTPSTSNSQEQQPQQELLLLLQSMIHNLLLLNQQHHHQQQPNDNNDIPTTHHEYQYHQQRFLPLSFHKEEGESRGYADDATWILTASFVILTMQSGFGLLEAGSCSPGYEINVMMKNIVDVIFTAFAFYLVGYGIAFGEPSNPFMGLGDMPADGGYDEVTSGLLYSKYVFQFSFAATATTIVSGCVAMRMRFVVYCIFSFVSTIFYSFGAHWLFTNNGWLHQLGSRDFAGGGTVHIFGGINGLIAILFLGPRSGRFDGSRPISDFFPSSPTSQIFGLFMLWWGWIGFNCGSSFGITDDKWVVAIRCAVTTINSTVGGGFLSILYSLWRTNWRLIIPEHVVNGILGSLVAITPCCAYVHTFDAFPIGFIGALVGLSLNTLICHIKLDDPVGAIGVHAGGGIWGLIAVGLFADSQLPGINLDQDGLFRSSGDGGDWSLLGYQMIAILSIMVWAATWSTIFFYIVGCLFSKDYKDPRTGLRQSAEEDERGADWYLHGVVDQRTLEDLTNKSKRTTNTTTDSENEEADDDDDESELLSDDDYNDDGSEHIITFHRDDNSMDDSENNNNNNKSKNDGDDDDDDSFHIKDFLRHNNNNRQHTFKPPKRRHRQRQRRRQRKQSLTRRSDMYLRSSLLDAATFQTPRKNKKKAGGGGGGGGINLGFLDNSERSYSGSFRNYYENDKNCGNNNNNNNSFSTTGGSILSRSDRSKRGGRASSNNKLDTTIEEECNTMMTDHSYAEDLFSFLASAGVADADEEGKQHHNRKREESAPFPPPSSLHQNRTATTTTPNGTTTTTGDNNNDHTNRRLHLSASNSIDRMLGQSSSRRILLGRMDSSCSDIDINNNNNNHNNHQHQHQQQQTRRGSIGIGGDGRMRRGALSRQASSRNLLLEPRIYR